MFPATVTGKNTRVTLDGKKHIKVYLDPLDKEKVESKLDAISHVYSKYTNQKIQIGFNKPNTFQKKVLEQKKQ